MAKGNTQAIIPISKIERKILFIREQKVILDSDLAELYGVPTKRFNEAVKRNIDRFPQDFMFQVSKEEAETLRSQFATLETGRGKHRKYLPRVFTEHGALMAANILRSKKAINVSIQIIRTFILMRQVLAMNSDLKRKMDHLEKRYDKQFQKVFETIYALMYPPVRKSKPIGFRVK